MNKIESLKMNGDFSKLAARIKKLFDAENKHRISVLNPNAFVSSRLRKYVQKLMYVDAFALKGSFVDRSLCYYELFEAARAGESSSDGLALALKAEITKKANNLKFAIADESQDALIHDTAKNKSYSTKECIQLLLEIECLRHEKVECLTKSTGEYKKKLKRKVAALEEFYKEEKISDSRAESDIVNSLELYLDESVEGLAKINGLLAIEKENGSLAAISPFQALFSPKLTLKIETTVH